MLTVHGALSVQDLMWQHRQEERELKRAEMDIVRQKKQVNKTMKDYETSNVTILYDTQFPIII